MPRLQGWSRSLAAKGGRRVFSASVKGGELSISVKIGEFSIKGGEFSVSAKGGEFSISAKGGEVSVVNRVYEVAAHNSGDVSRKSSLPMATKLALPPAGEDGNKWEPER